MTKKHFVAIATELHAIKRAYPQHADMTRDIADRFAHLCANYNDAFDYERFMLACGHRV